MLDFFTSIGSIIMTPLYYLVSGILVLWHEAFSALGLDRASGWSWALAIIFLTITIRVLLIPLFVKQIKSQRNMQLLQPQIRELQKKYGHDRERLTQEQMKLWRETGTNPFASCMPLLLQAPILFALFRVLDQAARKGSAGARGFLSPDQAEQLQGATLLGARIAETFMNADNIQTRVMTMSLVVIMCLTQYTTQRQLMAKNMPKESLEGPFAQQQKVFLYLLPVVFAVSGVIFPLGVLIYWTTTNIWTMGQQFYVIRNNPVPGTPAFEAKRERDRRKGKVDEAESQSSSAASDSVEPAKKQPQRNQQKNLTREQRRKQAEAARNAKPSGGSSGSSQGAPESNENAHPAEPDRASAKRSGQSDSKSTGGSKGTKGKGGRNPK